MCGHSVYTTSQEEWTVPSVYHVYEVLPPCRDVAYVDIPTMGMGMTYVGTCYVYTCHGYHICDVLRPAVPYDDVYLGYPTYGPSVGRTYTRVYMSDTM